MILYTCIYTPVRRVDNYKVQNKALRGFLGVGIHHPITALETESIIGFLQDGELG